MHAKSALGVPWRQTEYIPTFWYNRYCTTHLDLFEGAFWYKCEYILE